MAGDDFGFIDVIFYEGVCFVIIEWDGKYVMFNNYEYFKELLYYCLDCEIFFLYVFLVVIYGEIDIFIEEL